MSFVNKNGKKLTEREIKQIIDMIKEGYKNYIDEMSDASYGNSKMRDTFLAGYTQRLNEVEKAYQEMAASDKEFNIEDTLKNELPNLNKNIVDEGMVDFDEAESRAFQSILTNMNDPYINDKKYGTADFNNPIDQRPMKVKAGEFKLASEPMEGIKELPGYETFASSFRDELDFDGVVINTADDLKQKESVSGADIMDVVNNLKNYRATEEKTRERKPAFADVNTFANMYETCNFIADTMNKINQTKDVNLRKTQAVQLASLVNQGLFAEELMREDDHKVVGALADTILEAYGLPPHIAGEKERELIDNAEYDDEAKLDDLSLEEGTKLLFDGVKEGAKHVTTVGTIRSDRELKEAEERFRIQELRKEERTRDIDKELTKIDKILKSMPDVEKDNKALSKIRKIVSEAENSSGSVKRQYEVAKLDGLAFDFVTNDHKLLADEKGKELYNTVFAILGVVNKPLAKRAEKYVNRSETIAKEIAVKTGNKKIAKGKDGLYKTVDFEAAMTKIGVRSVGVSKELSTYEANTVKINKLSELYKTLTTSPVDPFYHKSGKEYKAMLRAIKTTLDYMNSNKLNLKKDVVDEMYKDVEDSTNKYINEKSHLAFTDRGKMRMQAAIEVLNTVNPEAATKQIDRINEKRKDDFSSDIKRFLYGGEQYVTNSKYISDESPYKKSLADLTKRIKAVSEEIDASSKKLNTLDSDALGKYVTYRAIYNQIKQMGQAEYDNAVASGKTKVPTEDVLDKAEYEVRLSQAFSKIEEKYHDQQMPAKDMFTDYVKAVAKYAKEAENGDLLNVKVVDGDQVDNAKKIDEPKIDDPLVNKIKEIDNGVGLGI